MPQGLSAGPHGLPARPGSRPAQRRLGTCLSTHKRASKKTPSAARPCQPARSGEARTAAARRTAGGSRTQDRRAASATTNAPAAPRRSPAGCDAGPGSGPGYRQGKHPPGDEDLGGQRERDRDPLHHAVVQPGNPGREDRQGRGADQRENLNRAAHRRPVRSSRQRRASTSGAASIAPYATPLTTSCTWLCHDSPANPWPASSM